MTEEISKFIAWNPKFELGIPVIDEQHKHLVALCNDLYQQLISNRQNISKEWQESFRSALKECANYVVTHFRDEETLMKASNYQRYKEHKNAHDIFTKKVLSSVASFENSTMSDAIQFVHFLYDWILSHIAMEDKMFAKPVLEYFVKNGNI